MSGETQTSIWPLPKFYFSVQLGGTTAATFQEVTGLDTEATASATGPVLGKVGNVTLRKGVLANDSALWNWINQIQLNTIARQTVVISLLDETGASKRVWTLNNAWPTKLTGTDLKSEGNEVAVESVEVAYETLVISAP
ncbi:phage tail protein [Nitrospirillum viridazoti Y2]|uniref:Phage tail-like protein n=1 Tax=Nitrospirillum amazonense TaxID=28077 RepID=A0A560HZA4_9PROT|nr:phage tail protein [Nitrospirillum amazonense]EGY00780.1 phage tail protein [Nitrospirillum amazonense Y2]TWB50919.1 phage tail-like protein [Nitrospirillum amazonense]